MVFCGVSIQTAIVPWCFRSVQESLGRKYFWGLAYKSRGVVVSRGVHESLGRKEFWGLKNTREHQGGLRLK